jgi:hypothetical protein
MTAMSPGLRRSVSDGELTMDELILRPRKRRSHLFVQSTLDAAQGSAVSPPGQGQGKASPAPLRSHASQLLPKELLPVMEGLFLLCGAVVNLGPTVYICPVHFSCFLKHFQACFRRFNPLLCAFGLLFSSISVCL